MIRVVILTLLLTGCGLFGGGSKPSITTGDNAQVEQTTSQAGSNAQAQEIGEVTTVNEDGIPTHWFIIGALIFGMIIPQPRFIKWLF